MSLSSIRERLGLLYGEENARAILPRLQALIARHAPAKIPSGEKWSQKDALLITYGDSLTGNGAPLRTLQEFLRQDVGQAISFVHLLPFYPFTSDDGFSVTDFREVREDLGNWQDIAALAGDYRLVFDGVINHVSASSRYVRGDLEGNPRFRDFCIGLPPDTDTSAVLRTRNLPLLHEYPAHDGPRWLWTTFSRDQVDLNFANPEVLLEILDVLLFYAARGASVIRLDAIPYLWKRLGTSCAHLPETHALIKLIRDVFDEAAPHVLLLTETNVPHQENISYFGDGGDEAQMIYNFPLAPLIVWSFYRGNAERLSDWAQEIGWISPRATYLNITATHDGIGMRPTEGILSEPEREELCQLSRTRNGGVTGKKNADGSVSPYELNLSFYDAINDPLHPASTGREAEKFLASQAIPLALMGVPGLYIHSLLGSRNDLDGVKSTGRARSINREQFSLPALREELSAPGSRRQLVFDRLLRMLRIRAGEPAFHPDARQEIPRVHPAVFAVRRRPEQSSSLLALHNVSDQSVDVALPREERGHDLFDLLAETRIPAAASIPLAPHQVRWLKIC